MTDHATPKIAGATTRRPNPVEKLIAAVAEQQGAVQAWKAQAGAVATSATAQAALARLRAADVAVQSLITAVVHGDRPVAAMRAEWIAQMTAHAARKLAGVDPATVDRAQYRSLETPGAHYGGQSQALKSGGDGQ